MKKQSGFTLIELLITVVIIAIITSVAIPSYRQHLLRTQRADATAALLRIAAQQEKWYLQNNTYTTDLTDLDVTTTANGFYTLSVSPADAATFTATATVDTSGPQKGDKKCTTFSIDSSGTRSAKGGTVDTTDICW